MSKVVAVIQARMGSTRLPGKVLRSLAGKPILWHIIHRLQQSETVDEICVATTADPSDDDIEKYAEILGISVIRGDEHDVLGRFEMAAKATDPHIIVRVNGDAPLLDPAFVDRLVRELQHHDADFVMLNPGEVCIHDGVDPFSRRALDFMLREAREDPIAREHVTGYLKEHQDKIRMRYIDMEDAYQFEGARLSVDTPADLKFMETLHHRLDAEAGSIHLPDVTYLLRDDPSLLTINSHVRQKSVTQMSGMLLVRCDGGGSLGFGHVSRCIAIAQAIRDTYGYGILFAMVDGPGRAPAIDRVKSAGFKVAEAQENVDEETWLHDLISVHAPVGLLCDVKTTLRKEALIGIAKTGTLVVTYDDGSDRRLAADIAFYPPVPQVQALDWTGAHAEVLSGWSYVVVPTEFVALKREQANLKRRMGDLEKALKRDDLNAPCLFVTMGGSDPLGLTTPVLHALSRAMQAGDIGDISVTVVVGPSVKNGHAIAGHVDALHPNFHAVLSPPSLSDFMSGQDIAISTYGVSAFELAYFDVPSLLICLDEDHEQSAQLFAGENVADVLRIHNGQLPEDFETQLASFLNDRPAHLTRIENLNGLIDGGGAERVAGIIADRLAERASAENTATA